MRIFQILGSLWASLTTGERTRHALRQLDERLLNDVGLTPGEIHAAARQASNRR